MSFGRAPKTKTYFASYAQAICFGPVDTLHRVRNGKTIIWEGPVFRSGANANGATHITTDIGTIRFYWGTSSQVADSLLQTLYVDGGVSAGLAQISPYKQVCYAVMEDVAFGAQTSPPTLTFEVSKLTANLTLDGKVGNVRAGGTKNYTSAPTVGFSGGGGSGAAATAYINPGGNITHIVVTNPGTGYTSAPTVTLTGGGGTTTSVLASIAHASNGNGVVPEMIYDLFTNTLYGLGTDPANLITADWVAASNTVRTEGLGFNVVLESPDKARAWIGRMLDLIRAVLYVKDGKVGIKLIRKASTSGLVTVDSAKLIDEPLPSNKLLSDTWNMTIINWVDRRNVYERASTPHYDDANREMRGEEVRKSFDFPFCNTAEVAEKVAARVGVEGGIPKLSATLHVLPATNITVGDLFWLNYPKTGFANRLMRCTGRTHNAPGQDGLRLECVEEFTHDPDTIHVPGQDNSGIGSAVDDDGKNITDSPVPTVAPRLATIPTGLKDGKADGLLAAYGWPNTLLDRAEIFFTWNPATQSYFSLTESKPDFPHEGQVVWFQRYRTTNWLFRIRFNTAAQADNVMTLESLGELLYLVVNGRAAQPSAGVDVDTFASWWLRYLDGGRITLVDSQTVEIEVTAGEFSSTALALQGDGTDGQYPSLSCYVGVLDAFGVARFDARNFERNGHNGTMNAQTGVWEDPDQIRYVKVQTSRGSASVDLADCPVATYERGVALTPSWGTHAESSALRADIEVGNYFDSAVETDLYATIAALDDALGAVYHGHDTDAEELLSEHPDLVLGRLYFERDGIYSETR